ncbi:hypothetical protein V6N12_029512 [Hibiscus sabdariffa]|uniref:ALA-interacting subunit n=1 Tax=Hibiscus sabdariffa TaxID=183260 RepID=A0ABR2CWD7_9ROSI
MPETVNDRQRRRDRESAFYLFTQQRLPACKPVLTPAWVIEIEERYDIECVPEPFRNEKVLYIQADSIPKNCSLILKVDQYMKAPIYIYYQLDNYYQNHRRYIRSRSDQQLLHGRNSHGTSFCRPVESNNNHPIVPCGLVAWSLFNDTFTFIRGKAELKVNRTNIAWKSDRDHKFGKNVYPFNFQNGTWIGGGKLNARIPLSDQEDLIVWMRISALPSFRKLYGRIEEDLDVGDYVVVQLMNNYNTYSFGGKKKLVLSTSNWLGGKNDFLGLAYVVVGSSSLTIAIVFMVLHLRSQRLQVKLFRVIQPMKFPSNILNSKPAEIWLAGLHNHRGWTSDPMEEVRHPIASSSGNCPCLVFVINMGCKQNWGAVAPARFVPTRKSSTCPRLETILEEGCENKAVFTKKLLLYLPVVLSTVFYFLLHKDMTRCA